MSMVARTSFAIALSLALAACGKSSDSSSRKSDDVAPVTRAGERPSVRSSAPASPAVAERARPELPSDDGEVDSDDGEAAVDDGEADLGRPLPGPAMAEFDRDGDGRLDAAEKAAMRTKRLDDLVTRMDRDGDGAISRDEMVSGDDVRAQRMARRFDRLDANHDGSLTREEIDSMMRNRGKRGWRGKTSGRPSPESKRDLKLERVR